jgi:hypothetical protein
VACAVPARQPTSSAVNIRVRVFMSSIPPNRWLKKGARAPYQ